MEMLCHFQNNKHKDLEIMTLENMFQSIIVDDRMERLNSAIEKVYGVHAVGAVYSENEELIQYTKS